MNRALAIISILILIAFGLVQVQLYRQTTALEALEAQLNDLSGQIEDMRSQPDGNPADDASGENLQCTPDAPRKQI
jgi:type II secretory pathway pseudopilin PulG